MKKLTVIIVIAIIVIVSIFLYLSIEDSSNKDNDEFPNIKMSVTTDRSSYIQGTNITIRYSITNEMDTDITPNEYGWEIFCIPKEDYNDYKNDKDGYIESSVAFFEVYIPSGENYYDYKNWTFTWNKEGEYYIIFKLYEWYDKEYMLFKATKEVKTEVTLTKW